KWEGIIVDPAGPLLALFAYEVIKVLTKEEFGFDYLLNFFLYAVLAAAVGLGVGYLLSKMINLGMIPEYLKSPIVLAMRSEERRVGKESRCWWMGGAYSNYE